MPMAGRYQPGLSAFCTPSTPQQSNANKTLDWLCSSEQNQKDVLTQLLNEHLKGSTAMQTPGTPGVDLHGLNKLSRNNKDDDDEQSFYSAPPSRMLIYLLIRTQKLLLSFSFSNSTR